jgi:hypothetical protein
MVEKYFKALFEEFIKEEIIPMLEPDGFKKTRIAMFKRKVNNHTQFIELDGFSALYVGYDLHFGVQFPKFNKLISNLFGLELKYQKTCFKVVKASYRFEKFEEKGVVPFFDLESKEDFPKAKQAIGQIYDNIIPEFYQKTNGLLKIRDFIMSVEIDGSKYQRHNEHIEINRLGAIEKAYLITRIFEPERAEEILEHFRPMIPFYYERFINESLPIIETLYFNKVRQNLESEK